MPPQPSAPQTAVVHEGVQVQENAGRREHAAPPQQGTLVKHVCELSAVVQQTPFVHPPLQHSLPLTQLAPSARQHLLAVQVPTQQSAPVVQEL